MELTEKEILTIADGIQHTFIIMIGNRQAVISVGCRRRKNPNGRIVILVTDYKFHISCCGPRLWCSFIVGYNLDENISKFLNYLFIQKLYINCVEIIFIS